MPRASQTQTSADAVAIDRTRSAGDDDGRLTLCLLSTTSRRAVAGLSSYLRGLSTEAQAECVVQSVARFEDDGSRGLDARAREQPRELQDSLGRLSIVGPATLPAPLLHVVRPLIHHPRTQWLSIRAFDAAFRRPLAAAMPTSGAVVHFTGTGWELLGFPGLAVARRRGLPFTVLPAMHPGEWGNSAVDGRLYRSANLVFALSRHERERLVELGVEPSRIRHTPLAPAVDDTGDGRRFRDLHRLADRPMVLFTGRKQRYKGYHSLIAAMALVRETFPDVVLVAAGPAGEPLETGVPPAALLDLGRCDDATKADALAACDVFCMPSAGESFGIVYAEAWAYGKPVVGGPAPAARELIEDAGGGLVVDQRPENVAGALRRLLEDAGERQRLGGAGRQTQERRYSWEAVWRAHWTAWQELPLASPPRREFPQTSV